jgi:hypothetical protein
LESELTNQEENKPSNGNDYIAFLISSTGLLVIIFHHWAGAGPAAAVIEL